MKNTLQKTLSQYRKLIERHKNDDKDDNTEALCNFFDKNNIFLLESVQGIPPLFPFLVEMPDFYNLHNYSGTELEDNYPYYIKILQSIFKNENILDNFLNYKDSLGRGLLAYLENPAIIYSLMTLSEGFDPSTENTVLQRVQYIPLIKDNKGEGIISQKYQVASDYKKAFKHAIDVNFNLSGINNAYLNEFNNNIRHYEFLTDIIIGTPKDSKTTVKILADVIKREMIPTSAFNIILKSFCNFTDSDPLKSSDDNIVFRKPLDKIIPFEKNNEINQLLLPIFLNNWIYSISFTLSFYKDHLENNMSQNMVQNDLQDCMVTLWKPLVNNITLDKKCSYSTNNETFYDYILNFLKMAEIKCIQENLIPKKSNNIFVFEPVFEALKKAKERQIILNVKSDFKQDSSLKKKRMQTF